MRNEHFADHYGFVIDYLAEALRELRKQNFTEIIDHYFSLGSHLNARDRKAVRRTVSGMMKILQPHGQVSQQDLVELLELALEGRRRVKEQLKKFGGMEFFDVHFSYIDQETLEETFVSVPEQGGRQFDPGRPAEPWRAAHHRHRQRRALGPLPAGDPDDRR
jgi:ATP-dependent Lon protease